MILTRRRVISPGANSANGVGGVPRRVSLEPGSPDFVSLLALGALSRRRPTALPALLYEDDDEEEDDDDEEEEGDGDGDGDFAGTDPLTGAADGSTAAERGGNAVDGATGGRGGGGRGRGGGGDDGEAADAGAGGAARGVLGGWGSSSSLRREAGGGSGTAGGGFGGGLATALGFGGGGVATAAAEPREPDPAVPYPASVATTPPRPPLPPLATGRADVSPSPIPSARKAPSAGAANGVSGGGGGGNASWSDSVRRTLGFGRRDPPPARGPSWHASWHGDDDE